jgi:hypothetical protein
MYADWKFYVDFNNDGDFSESGEDITAFVVSANWTMGRDYAGMLQGRSMAGMATLELRNHNGEFNSYNSSSPYYGLILPNRRVKITATYDGTTYTMWSGFLQDIAPDLDLSGCHNATLTALGPLSFLTSPRVSLPMSTSIKTGAVIDAVLDAVGWPAGDRDIATGSTTIERLIMGESIALDAARIAEDTEFGFIKEEEDIKIGFEDRNYRSVSARSTTSQSTFSDSPSSVLKYQIISPLDSKRQIANYVYAKVYKYSVGALQVLWTHPETGANSPSIPAGESITLWAECPSGFVAVDAWTTPAATTDFLANSNPLGGGTNLTASIAITATKFDTATKLVITNGSASTAYLTFFQARGTPVSKSDGVKVESSDAVSKSRYGYRDFPLTSEFLPSTTEAQLYCDFIKNNYKDTQPLLYIEFLASSDETHLVEALSRKLSDRITVVGTGVMKLGIYQDFFVESISHSVSDGGRNHRTGYQLSPASVFEPAWVLGTSVLGIDTVLSPRW